MNNHFHLLLRPGQVGLAAFMRRLLTGYAVVFNLKHQRAGHLFQNRYKSIVCQEDIYLLELVRYIHLNPLRVALAKSIEELDVYPWSGHSVIMGKGALDGQQTDEILSLFGRGKERGRRLYRQFVIDGIDKGRRDELVGGGLRRSLAEDDEPGGRQACDARILGSGGFVENLWREVETSPLSESEITLAELVHLVTEKLGIEKDALRQRTKRFDLAEAKAAICYLATRRHGFSGVEVAKVLNLTRSGVSVAARRGADIAREKSPLRDLMES